MWQMKHNQWLSKEKLVLALDKTYLFDVGLCMASSDLHYNAFKKLSFGNKPSNVGRQVDMCAVAIIRWKIHETEVEFYEESNMWVSFEPYYSGINVWWHSNYVFTYGFGNISCVKTNGLFLLIHTYIKRYCSSQCMIWIQRAYGSNIIAVLFAFSSKWHNF